MHIHIPRVQHPCRRIHYKMLSKCSSPQVSILLHPHQSTPTLAPTPRYHPDIPIQVRMARYPDLCIYISLSLSLYVSLYTCVYLSMYHYPYTFPCTSVPAPAFDECICTRVHLYMCICMPMTVTRMPTSVHPGIHACINTCLHIC